MIAEAGRLTSNGFLCRSYYIMFVKATGEALKHPMLTSFSEHKLQNYWHEHMRSHIRYKIKIVLMQLFLLKKNTHTNNYQPRRIHSCKGSWSLLHEEHFNFLSSIQTTGFQKDSNPENEIIIANADFESCKYFGIDLKVWSHYLVQIST